LGDRVHDLVNVQADEGQPADQLRGRYPEPEPDRGARPRARAASLDVLVERGSLRVEQQLEVRIEQLERDDQSDQYSEEQQVNGHER